jgi:hypothetical protein
MILQKMKKGLFGTIFFIIFSFIFTNQPVLKAEEGFCSSFSAGVTGSSVTLTASACSPSGEYLVQVLQNNEVIQANEILINEEGGNNSVTFHLSRTGDYQARLLFSYDIVNSTTFFIQNVTFLECGNPCNPNDPNCPPECSSRWTGSAWYCLRPEEPNPGEPIPPLQTKGVQTALGFIPTEPRELVTWIFPYLLSLGGLVAFSLIVFSGIGILTSAGNPEKIQGAKETITSAVVGLLFIILSLFLLRLIGIKILELPGLE